MCKRSSWRFPLGADRFTLACVVIPALNAIHFRSADRNGEISVRGTDGGRNASDGAKKGGGFMREICKRCGWSRSRMRDSCYCTKFGIIIGYSKVSCDSFKEEDGEQVQRKENGGRRKGV